MPPDASLLPEWSQQLLRAARAGNLFDPPSKASDSTNGGSDRKENEDVNGGDTFSHGQKGVTVKKWARVSRHMEEPEHEYLAKRRKGLPSLRNGVAGSRGLMRKTKIKKADGEGNENIWQVLVPEGQTVKGEILNEDEAMLAVPKSVTPNTVIEGVGNVNSDGLIVVRDDLISTPPRRRPPPPRRKPKKGPGRGRKKVLFKPGEDGSAAAAGSTVLGTKTGAVNGTSQMSGESQDQDKDVAMADVPDGEDNDQENEGEGEGEGDDDDEEEEGEIDEGEEDEDREEGESSSSSPSPSAQAIPAADDSRPAREHAQVTAVTSPAESHPKPKTHSLPAAPIITSALPPKPGTAGMVNPQTELPLPAKMSAASTGNSVSPSSHADHKSSRANFMGRDRDVKEPRQPVSLVPQHHFSAASLPPAPIPQHSLSRAGNKSLKSPTKADLSSEAVSLRPEPEKSTDTEITADGREPDDRRTMSSSPDLPLVQTITHSRKSSVATSKVSGADVSDKQVPPVQEDTDLEMADRVGLKEKEMKEDDAQLSPIKEDTDALSIASKPKMPQETLMDSSASVKGSDKQHSVSNDATMPVANTNEKKEPAPTPHRRLEEENNVRQSNTATFTSTNKEGPKSNEDDKNMETAATKPNGEPSGTESTAEINTKTGADVREEQAAPVPVPSPLATEAAAATTTPKNEATAASEEAADKPPADNIPNNKNNKKTETGTSTGTEPEQPPPALAPAPAPVQNKDSTSKT